MIKPFIKHGIFIVCWTIIVVLADLDIAKWKTWVILGCIVIIDVNSAVWAKIEEHED